MGWTRTMPTPPSSAPPNSCATQPQNPPLFRPPCASVARETPRPALLDLRAGLLASRRLTAAAHLRRLQLGLDGRGVGGLVGRAGRRQQGALAISAPERPSETVAYVRTDCLGSVRKLKATHSARGLGVESVDVESEQTSLASVGCRWPEQKTAVLVLSRQSSRPPLPQVATVRFTL